LGKKPQDPTDNTARVLDSTSDSSSEAPDTLQKSVGSEKSSKDLSLILFDDPGTSNVLLFYLKGYSEMLLSWGLTSKAVQACKVASKACHIMAEYHKTPDNSKSQLEI
jgi:hypothetical protein